MFQSNVQLTDHSLDVLLSSMAPRTRVGTQFRHYAEQTR